MGHNAAELTEIQQRTHALTQNLPHWSEASRVLGLIEEGRIDEALSYLPFLNTITEAATALSTVILFEVRNKGTWEKTHKSFEAYCQERFHRSRTTVFQTIKNLEFFLHLGQSRKIFYRASVRIGWTRIQELRQAPPGLVTRENLEEKIAEIEAGQITRSLLHQQLGGEEAHGSKRIFSRSLPENVLESLLQAMADAKERWNLTNDIQAIEVIVGEYWKSATREAQEH